MTDSRRDQARRAFFAGWMRFNTAAEVDDARMEREFRRWFDDGMPVPKPEIWTERRPLLHKNYSEPFYAHILTDKSDHHGVGRSPAEALFNAASHWLSYTNLPRDWQSPTWTDSGWHRHVAEVIKAGWSMLTDDQKRALASSCAQKDAGT